MASSEQVAEMIEALREAQAQQAKQMDLMMKMFANKNEEKEEKPKKVNAEDGPGKLKPKAAKRCGTNGRGT